MKTDNELIAEFMGYSRLPKTGHWIKPGMSVAKPLSFDSNWGELMPVVEKINGMNHAVHIYPTRTRFYKASTEFIESIHPGYSLLDVVYCGVIEFIKWHNQHTT